MRSGLPQATASWEIILAPEKSRWYLTVPSEWELVVKKQLRTVWPNTTIEAVPDPLDEVEPSMTATGGLKEHYLFSLKIDLRTGGIVPSLLDVVRLMGQHDKVAVQMLFKPVAPNWWMDAANVYENFRRGKTPERIRFNAQMAQKLTARTLAGVAAEIHSVLNELLVGQPSQWDLDGGDRQLSVRERHTSLSQKLKGDVLDLTLRVAIQTEDANQARNLLRSVGFSLRELDGDNALELMRSRTEPTWEAMKARRAPMKINSDFLSTKEVAQLLQLPTGPLQAEHRLPSVRRREIKLPAKVLDPSGIRIGVQRYRGKDYPVHLPTDNYDELCLARTVIGGQGTGKTRGFAANLAARVVEKGFVSISIDAAKGELGDEVELVLPPEKVHRIRFGDEVMALDFAEVRHSTRQTNRYANELIAFFDDASDTAGAQTVRYLRSAAKVVPSGRLDEVMDIFTSSAYRASLLDHMPERDRFIWEEFEQLGVGRQAQIVAPILNRLDVVMGDDYLFECMESTKSLDVVELVDSGPKAIILDVPKRELGAEAVDVLVSLLNAKIFLSMALRKTEYPVFVILDEPHQYLRSARTWRSAVVESRKWRYSYTWLFHSWEQIPSHLAKIIQSALVHYHVYSSSKDTYKSLAEELAPFGVEEGLATKNHDAIHALHVDGERITPFMAKMDAPPSVRLAAPSTP